MNSKIWSDFGALPPLNVEAGGGGGGGGGGVSKGGGGGGGGGSSLPFACRGCFF